PFRTGNDAEPAGLARVGTRRVRRPLAMGQHLETRQPRQRPVVGVVDAPHLEDVVGTDVDAIVLGLAAAVVDPRPAAPGRGFALGARPVRMGGRAPRFLDVAAHATRTEYSIPWPSGSVVDSNPCAGSRMNATYGASSVGKVKMLSASTTERGASLG